MGDSFRHEADSFPLSDAFGMAAIVSALTPASAAISASGRKARRREPKPSRFPCKTGYRSRSSFIAGREAGSGLGNDRLGLFAEPSAY
jgi:hypothetical protein